MKNYHFKNRLLVLLCMLTIAIQMTSCVWSSLCPKGYPYTFNIKEAKKLNTFICEYVPSSEYVEIDGKKVKLPIREVYAEKLYNMNTIQVVVHYNGNLKLSKEHTGEIYINNFNDYSKNHPTDYREYSREGDVSALPDSIRNYIIEIREIKTDSGTVRQKEILQTFWFVKMP